MTSTQSGNFVPPLVVLSFAMSFLGAYLAISICEQLRQSVIEDKSIFGKDITIVHRKYHLVYLLCMALSIGGIGIWSMHFIGMNSFKLHDIDHHHVQVRYSIPLSVASFITVIVTTFIGVTVASTDPMFSKTKGEIVEEFIVDSKNLPLSQIRKITSRQIFIGISTKSLNNLLVGGMITGSGVSVMHYIGMKGTMFNGQILWNPGLIALSVIIAIVASTVAFWIFFRLLSIFPDKEILRLLSAFVMAIAVCGMHYTGMCAGDYRVREHYFVYSSSREKDESMNDKESFPAAMVGANILLWLITLGVLWNSRQIIYRQGILIRQADAVLLKLADSSSSVVDSQTDEKQISRSTSKSTTIRNMADIYLRKRYNGFSSPNLTSRANSEMIERQNQVDMGFFEYMLHICLLVMTCKWKSLSNSFKTFADSMHSSGSTNSKVETPDVEAPGAIFSEEEADNIEAASLANSKISTIYVE